MSTREWNYSLYQSESLTHLFETLIEDFDRAALVLSDGRTLHLRSRAAEDMATLPVAAFQCNQYLKLKHGELAICNDPFTGGTRLSDLTLVMGINMERSVGPADLLVAHRFSTQPILSLSGNINQEGVRIPPTPLGSISLVNKDLLAAIGCHPLAPKNFAAMVEKSVADLAVVRKRLSALTAARGLDWKKLNLRRYFQDCQQAVLHLISKLSLGETLMTGHLESGEQIKLHLEITDEKVQFDLSGTETSSRVQLTDLAVFGACFSALSAALNQPLPANAGTFALVEVRTPGTTLVNAKFPAATERGLTNGMDFLSNLAVRAFGRISANHRFAASAVGVHHLQIEFSDGRVLHQTLPGGTGAGSRTNGIDGWSLWRPLSGTLESPEAVEREFPVLLKGCVLRTNSGGKGQWPGGQGLIKTLQVLEPAKLRWSLEQVSHRADGTDGGKGGATIEINVLHADGEKEKFPAEGEFDLAPGDVVRIMSGGGGGFGEPPTTT